MQYEHNKIEIKSKRYCNDLFNYSRWRTRVVDIGGVPLGGDNPIRLQSMTTTDTMDTIKTVEQSIRIIEAGADYVRITAPSVKDAENLQNIKDELRKRGYKTPLVADIHFVPKAAEVAAKIVEKVRVNPGNYADRKKFKVFSFTDEMYQNELDRIRKEFTPLVKICKEYGTAMRIGTNHGSLSDRIMNRYGDTPLGMVESALEFVRICEDMDYREIVLSMKASNPKVMVEAYRLLVNKMISEGMNYPIHLGVTEAGDGADGRIKSAAGIGALLEDGIGDTVRVSLTEEPEFEIPVCKRLVERYEKRVESRGLRVESEGQNGKVESSKLKVQSEEQKQTTPAFGHPSLEKEGNHLPYDPFNYERRKTRETDKIGNHHVPVVILSADGKPQENLWENEDMFPDYIYLGNRNFDLPSRVKKIFDYEYWKSLEDKSDVFPLFNVNEYMNVERKSYGINFVEADVEGLSDELLKAVNDDKFAVLILKTMNENTVGSLRSAFVRLQIADYRLEELSRVQSRESSVVSEEQGLKSNGEQTGRSVLLKRSGVPVIIKRSYEKLDEENVTLYAATDFAGLMLDGFGDGVWLESDSVSSKQLNEISFGILQATRTRISKTEYISCPSCGRTQFDLMETTAMIKEKTDHLKGLKIAVMGCIVNGPGEMADADYGYVGSGPGWISLYRGHEVIERGIPYAEALDKLIEIIKEDGEWVEPV